MYTFKIIKREFHRLSVFFSVVVIVINLVSGNTMTDEVMILYYFLFLIKCHYKLNSNLMISISFLVQLLRF